jgi:hypothetical protein
MSATTEGEGNNHRRRRVAAQHATCGCLYFPRRQTTDTVGGNSLKWPIEGNVLYFALPFLNQVPPGNFKDNLNQTAMTEFPRRFWLHRFAAKRLRVNVRKLAGSLYRGIQ